jgi:hypothetical protein
MVKATLLRKRHCQAIDLLNAERPFSRRYNILYKRCVAILQKLWAL